MTSFRAISSHPFEELKRIVAGSFDSLRFAQDDRNE